MKIKHFDEFDTKNVNFEPERKSMERELITRKKMRIQTNSLVSLENLKSQIECDIITKEEYHITAGNRIEIINGSKKDMFHVEYESPQIGRLRVFKPEDSDDIGLFEINGEIFDTDVNVVREFYIFLKNMIK